MQEVSSMFDWVMGPESECAANEIPETQTLESGSEGRKVGETLQHCLIYWHYQVQQDGGSCPSQKWLVKCWMFNHRYQSMMLCWLTIRHRMKTTFKINLEYLDLNKLVHFLNIFMMFFYYATNNYRWWLTVKLFWKHQPH